EALAGLCADRASKVLRLSPYAINGIRFPVFLTGCGFEIITDNDGDDIVMRLEPLYSFADCGFERLMIAGKWQCDENEGSFDGGYTSFDIAFDPGKHALTLKGKTDIS
ncbi:MAG: hypothetical protein IJT56_04225, partial [Clostridia bacterium]|nr:hypothetical protein [Clostridia bacterium]